MINYFDYLSLANQHPKYPVLIFDYRNYTVTTIPRKTLDFGFFLLNEDLCNLCVDCYCNTKDGDFIRRSLILYGMRDSNSCEASELVLNEVLGKIYSRNLFRQKSFAEKCEMVAGLCWHPAIVMDIV